jgi:uncharacterized DUF497 family protein
VEFEWDPEKAASNRRKHEVTFQQAATVFGDPLATTFPDPDHSVREHRSVTIGMSEDGRPLVGSPVPVTVVRRERRGWAAVHRGRAGSHSARPPRRSICELPGNLGRELASLVRKEG